MKNLIYVAIAAVVAFFIYGYISKQNIAQQDPVAPATNQVASQQVAQTKTDVVPATPTNNAFKDLISKSAEGADVFILEPGDGATVSSPVTVKFGITNMTVAKAGENIEFSGHHHLLINVSELPDMSAPLPATDQIIHFGGAQTETTIELEPGQHTLQLLLGNYLHIPHDTPVVSKKITVTVQ